MKSIDILKTVSIEEANDLYLPALDNYKELRPSNYKLPKNSYFSGSGSSFFYINE
jgi:4-diphosphocytidyl-2-C-methyl-D-erythritol kinase